MTSCVGVQEGPCPLDEGAWHWDGCHWESPLEAFGVGILGFCGCGDPEGLAELFATYLGLLALRGDTTDDWTFTRQAVTELFGNEWLELLAMYVCDNKKLTEHGGSVYGAWLTTLGKEWVTLLTR